MYHCFVLECLNALVNLFIRNSDASVIKMINCHLGYLISVH